MGPAEATKLDLGLGARALKAQRFWRFAPLSAALLLPKIWSRHLVAALENSLEYRRNFVLLPFCLVLGLAIYAHLPAEPDLYLLLFGLFFLLALLGLFYRRFQLGYLFVTLDFAFVWIGLMLLPVHGLAFGTPMLAYPSFGTYEARVDAVLETDETRQRVILSDLTPLNGARLLPIKKARVILPPGERVEQGDRISAAMRLAPIPGPVLPGAFDGQFHAFFSGVGAYGNVTSGFTRVAEGEAGDLGRQVQKLRRAIAQRIDTALGPETAGIGKAMVVGDQSGITDETRDVMAASGLAHIYSISGLHLSIVAGGIFYLLRWALAGLPMLIAWPIKTIAALVGIAAAFAYLLLAGGMDNVPAFRSTLMLGLIFGAIVVGRQALTMRNVAIAALVIIVIDPASVFRASFQLSFAAVVALIGIYELPRAKIPHGGSSLQRGGKLIAATAWTSFIAGGATLLFSAYHFQQTAPLGVLGNVLALPFVSLIIMPFGVLAVLLIPLGLDFWPFRIMGWGIDCMVSIAELVAGWSEAFTENPLLADWTLLAGLLALGWFAFTLGPWKFLAPVLAAPLILMFGFLPRPDVLIADTTQAIAVRDGAQMALVSGRTGSFAVEVWSRHYQTEIAQTHPQLRCDSLGCILSAKTYSIAVVKNAAAFAEDCGAHDLLITRIEPPQNCWQKGDVIGPSALRLGGVHVLVWNEAAGRFDQTPAISALNRPWRIAQR